MLMYLMDAEDEHDREVLRRIVRVADIGCADGKLDLIQSATI